MAFTAGVNRLVRKLFADFEFAVFDRLQINLWFIPRIQSPHVDPQTDFRLLLWSRPVKWTCVYWEGLRFMVHDGALRDAISRGIKPGVIVVLWYDSHPPRARYLSLFLPSVGSIYPLTFLIFLKSLGGYFGFFPRICHFTKIIFSSGPRRFPFLFRITNFVRFFFNFVFLC